MKLLVIYPEALGSAWSLSEGLARTLARLGHDVTPVPCPNNKLPRRISLLEMEEQDAVIISGLEHLLTSLEDTYKRSEWASIKAPKLAWYHESFERPDYNLNIDTYKPWADIHCFPAAQDADRWGYWLPFAADTTIFKPTPRAKKTDEAIFIGSVYGIRQEFINDMMKFPADSLVDGQLPFKHFTVEGSTLHESMELYAEAVRKAKVFINLPTLSNLYVTKVFEVMACGTALVTPELRQIGRPNASLFGDAEYFTTYTDPITALDSLQHLLFYPETREITAKAGCDYVHKHHSLEKRCKQLVTILGHNTRGHNVI